MKISAALTVPIACLVLYIRVQFDLVLDDLPDPLWEDVFKASYVIPGAVIFGVALAFYAVLARRTQGKEDKFSYLDDLE